MSAIEMHEAKPGFMHFVVWKYNSFRVSICLTILLKICFTDFKHTIHVMTTMDDKQLQVRRIKSVKVSLVLG